MPLSPAQIEQRKKHLGSSDMAAVVGVSPYKTGYDVWLEKTEKVEPDDPSKAAKAGRILEHAVLAYAESKLGAMTRNQYRSMPSAHLGANVDAILDQTAEPVEGKTSGLHGAMLEGWQAEGTDGVPDSVIIQAHVHMLCVRDWLTRRHPQRMLPTQTHVPALLGGRGFQMFHVPYNEKIANAVVAEAVTFWEQYVEKDIPPGDSIGTPEVLKRVRRTPNKVTDMDPRLVADWLAAKNPAKLIAEMLVFRMHIRESGLDAVAAIVDEGLRAADDTKHAVITALGDAEAANAGEQGGVTYYQYKRSPNKRLVELHKLVCEAREFVKEASERVITPDTPDPEATDELLERLSAASADAPRPTPYRALFHTKNGVQA